MNVLHVIYCRLKVRFRPLAYERTQHSTLPVRLRVRKLSLQTKGLAIKSHLKKRDLSNICGNGKKEESYKYSFICVFGDIYPTLYIAWKKNTTNIFFLINAEKKY